MLLEDNTDWSLQRQKEQHFHNIFANLRSTAKTVVKLNVGVGNKRVIIV